MSKPLKNKKNNWSGMGDMCVLARRIEGRWRKLGVVPEGFSGMEKALRLWNMGRKG